MTLWPEISERSVVVYGVGLRYGVHELAKQYAPGPLPDEAALAVDRVLWPLPFDLQTAIMLAWMKAAILVNDSIHRRRM